MQEVVYSVIRPDLADGYYLDFDSRRIDWERWLIPYARTSINRQGRSAPTLKGRLSGKIDTLLSMIETFALHMAIENTYIGNVELQLALHALITLRFEPNGSSLGDAIRPMIEEILMHYERELTWEQFDMLSCIISKLCTRFKHLQTPVIDGKLVYPPGKIMGVNAAVNW